MTKQPSQYRAKILLAEDNPVVLKSISAFLDKWGYETIAANNGDTAWEIFKSDHSIQLAIVDWNLPGLSGIQICQRLRTRTNAPYVYIIMFSARKSHEEKIMALDGGADEYLVKPCKPSELRARIGVGRRIIDAAFNATAPSQNKNPIQQDPSTISEETDTETEDN